MRKMKMDNNLNKNEQGKELFTLEVFEMQFCVKIENV